ncbi:DUF2950 family protein [Paraburkholderia steynii]|uniref:DUF2950 family protein n=1 Tax=Paraburkholderia steynii TaxID=1245441 RepID=UPI003CC67555
MPLVQTPDGWQFDPVAGRSEPETRRICHTERATMLTSLAYLDAQSEYRNLTGRHVERFMSALR